MKMKSLPVRSICSYLLVLCGIVVLQRCAAVYQPVYPERLVMNDQRWIGPDTTVEIELTDDVLAGPHSKQYARMEKQNGVDLIALRIRNYGSHDLHLPNDLKLFTRSGDTISILTVEEALSDLVELITLDHSNSIVEVETDPNWVKYSWNVSNDVRQIQSHIRFANNISNEYLKNCIIHPGQEASGFVVLPIPEGTPFQFCIR